MAGTVAERDALAARDIAYEHGATRLSGLLRAPAGVSKRPAVVLIHDAFGLAPEMVEVAERIAETGVPVFAADMWGDRRQPASEAEIGPLIGGMVSNRAQWIERVARACEVAAEQPEIDGERLIMLGYCFGGSSALEYLRTGGKLLGVVAIHPGLDLVEFDWSAAETTASDSTAALVCLGADDPMAAPELWRQTKTGMNTAGVDWELALYSGTVHAFTSPKAAHSPNPAVVAYHPRNAARAWSATERFISEHTN